MKKRTTTVQILLLLAVLFIWTKVIIGLFDLRPTNEKPSLNADRIPAFPSLPTPASDSYTLSLDYADPFGQTDRTSRKTAQKIQPAKTSLQKSTDINQQIAQIIYTGYAHTEVEKVAVLTIAGRAQRYHERDTVLNYTLYRITKDSIVLRTNGHSDLVFYRN